MKSNIYTYTYTYDCNVAEGETVEFRMRKQKNHQCCRKCFAEYRISQCICESVGTKWQCVFVSTSTCLGDFNLSEKCVSLTIQQQHSATHESVKMLRYRSEFEYRNENDPNVCAC